MVVTPEPEIMKGMLDGQGFGYVFLIIFVIQVIGILLYVFNKKTKDKVICGPNEVP